jgi:hypothetical protein
MQIESLSKSLVGSEVNVVRNEPSPHIQRNMPVDQIRLYVSKHPTDSAAQNNRLSNNKTKNIPFGQQFGRYRVAEGVLLDGVAVSGTKDPRVVDIRTWKPMNEHRLDYVPEENSYIKALQLRGGAEEGNSNQYYYPPPTYYDETNTQRSY